MMYIKTNELLHFNGYISLILSLFLLVLMLSA